MNQRSNEGTVGHVIGRTRWEILGELCQGAKTASEIAARVNTSANAVRVHLEALQQAGLVTYTVERRSVGKPTHVYALTGSGESLLSRAYAPALVAILGAARRAMNGSFLPMLREAGDSLGAASPADASTIGGVPAAVRFLESFGAAVTVEPAANGALLQASCCPLAAVSRTTPEICRMIEAALETTAGMKAAERCARGDHPRCRFEMTGTMA